MKTLDKEAVKNNLNISIGDLEFLEKELWELVKKIWKDNLKQLLSKYYFYRVSKNLNAREYESLGKLEGIMDLYNAVNEPG